MYIVRKTGYIIKNETAVPRGTAVGLEPVIDLGKLAETIKTNLSAQLSRLEIDTRAPRKFVARLINALWKNISSSAADLGKAAGTGYALDEAVGLIAAIYRRHMEKNSRVVEEYDVELKKHLALKDLEADGYLRYLFISERTTTTCDNCLSRHGEVYSPEDLESGRALPPLHPNCGCCLIVMDSAAENMYNMENERFFALLAPALERLDGELGGIFVLDHDFSVFGISPSTLTRLTLPSGHLVKMRGGEDERDGFLEGITALLENSAAARAEGVFDSYGESYTRALIGLETALMFLTGSKYISRALSNYESNKDIELRDGEFIYNQYGSTLSGLKVGGYGPEVACGPVAVYNALILFGQWRHLAEIVLAAEAEGGLCLWGRLGTNFSSLQDIMDAAGLPGRTAYLPGSVDELIKRSNSGVAILEYWKGKEAHYVAVQYEDGMYYVYNGPDNADSYKTLSMDKWIDENKHFVLGLLYFN